MAKYHKVEGISTKELSYFMRRDTSNKDVYGKYINGLKQPDILDQDRDIYNSTVMKYISDAEGIAEKYRSNPNYDIEGEVLKIRNNLMSEFNSGVIAQLRKRKTDYDNILEATKKARTPQEYNEAFNAITVEPAINSDGTYGKVYMKDFYTSRDDYAFDKSLKSFIGTIKPDQVLSDWTQSNDFDPSKQDLYTLDKIKSIAQDKVTSAASKYILASEDYKRYAELNPQAPLLNEDGTFNEENKFGLKGAAYTTAASYSIADQIQKTFMDPKYRTSLISQGAYARQAATQQAKPTIVKPYINDTMDEIGDKKYYHKTIPFLSAPDQYLDREDNKITTHKYVDRRYSPEQKRNIVSRLNALITASSKKGEASTDISTAEAKRKGLDKEQTLVIDIDGSGTIYIDLRQTHAKIQDELRKILVPITENTSTTATEYNKQ